MESCFTCKVVSTGGALGVAGYFAYLSQRLPKHSIFFKMSSATFVGVAGMNWYIRTTQEQMEAARKKD